MQARAAAAPAHFIRARPLFRIGKTLCGHTFHLRLAFQGREDAPCMAECQRSSFFRLKCDFVIEKVHSLRLLYMWGWFWSAAEYILQTYRAFMTKLYSSFERRLPIKFWHVLNPLPVLQGRFSVSAWAA